MAGHADAQHDAEVHLFTARTFAVPGMEDVEAFATLGDRIVAVGTADHLRARFPGAPRTDFGDVAVLPGFNDAHMHPSKAADYGLVANLAPPAVRDLDDLYATLRRQAERSDQGDWIRGARYDQGKTSGGVFIDRTHLDRVSTDRPIYVRHISGHFGILNSKALEVIGVDRDTPDPTGGEIRRDSDGEPNGVLVGRAQERVVAAVPPLEMDDSIDGLRTLAQDLHASGITSVTDAMVMPAGLELFQEARRRDAFRLRTNLLLSWKCLDMLDELQLRSEFGDEWLRFGGIKATWDGAVAGRTCFMEEPFDGTDDHGLLLMSQDEIEMVVDRVHRTGSRLAIHANGDAAISSLLDVFEATVARHGPGPVRHRIEHGSIVNPDILRRAAALDLIIVPLFSYVWFHGEKITEFFGRDRLGRTIACRSMLDAGITVAGSSDFGAGPFPPLANIEAVVTRRDWDGRDLDASQAITVDEAIHAYTVAAAETSGEAHLKGRIAPGYLADFVVLEQDPRSIDPDDLAELPVLSTWIGAEQVWSR